MLIRFREGNPEVLELVYRSYVRGLDRYLCALARRTGHYELTQVSALADMIQDVFLDAFSAKSRASYDGQRDYGAYLNGIARNRFLDAIRVGRREIPWTLDDLPVEVEERDEFSQLRDPKVRLVVELYLKELPEPLLGVYEQRFVLGKSQIEACDVLRMSRRQLRTAEERLRGGLRKALFRAGISPLRESHDGWKILRPTRGGS
jgi:RNA polymerase sigma factor (sigma-70 family)